ncbi:UNVERIFIED_CONTAM: putative mitochondrial protein [Sesamum latifolium]|uniref:Mitochondrial protein n=1 Tax=Sesamum latifolium TaxID=2727402 RepID=A0AAW2YC64_9LAMI
MVRARLDRAISNSRWANFFPSATVHHEGVSSSDHAVLWVVLQPEKVRAPRHKKPRFRFEAAWLSNQESAEVVRMAWDAETDSDPQIKITNKIRACQTNFMRASERKVSKTINKICDANGVEVSGVDEIHKGSLNPNFNYTHVVLIPKCPNPVNMSHFRPISLCNVIYKLASKTIANRLKPFLNSIISPAQSVFVLGRLITDNVLVAYELNHFLGHKMWGKKGHASLNLDISKVYDRVEWCFLERVMIKLGFHSSFVRLVMNCVTTVTFSFLLNGEQFGFLRPERGLHQGDPLSPYLFLLCAEFFSSLIRKAESEGRLQGIVVFRQASRISHLLFVDDTLIFCQATTDAFSCIQNILLCFEWASGLQINTHKSAVVFSKNVDNVIQATLANILEVPVITKHDKYLGLPTVAGWLVLIKAVILTIPSYVMSCFRLPDSFLKDIESMGSFGAGIRPLKFNGLHGINCAKGRRKEDLDFDGSKRVTLHS